MPYLNPLLRSIIHPDIGFVSLGGVEVIAIEVGGAIVAPPRGMPVCGGLVEHGPPDVLTLWAGSWRGWGESPGRQRHPR